ncbi:MAG: SemiSWEET transporter [Spirochaetales bacterium]|nr:SemiSWEET transporter [Spirochaetales bacterium]
MQLMSYVGFLAAFLTTVSFVPQVWKTLKTRDTSSISLLMYTLFTLGVASWLAWGLWAGQWPVIIANALTLVLASIVLAFKIWDVAIGKEKP